MKKATFIFVLSIFWTSFAYARTTYYLDASNGNNSNAGTSSETPWQTLNHIVSYPFQPGDSILLKRGETWKVTLRINSSGAIDQPITVGAYGTGEKPRINVVEQQNFNWTSIGVNLWRSTDLTYNPKRVLKDGEEILGAGRIQPEELGMNIPDLVEWRYGAGNFDIYSVQSPANHSISFSSTPFALYLNKNSHIHIKDIELIGGYVASVVAKGVFSTRFTNLVMGQHALQGIQILPGTSDAGAFFNSDQVAIENCVIDSGYTFDYSNAGTALGVSSRGASEGILIRGVINSELKGNYIRNYTHASLNLWAPSNADGSAVDGRAISNNKIHGNTITSPDIAYGGRVVLDGHVFDNEIYNNLIVDIAVRNQFNGFRNHIHHNIIKGVRSSPLKRWPTGQAIALQGYYSAVFDNIFENNLIIDCESSGIFISGNNGVGDITNNIFRNNTVYNCGTSNNNIGIRIDTDTNSRKNDNTFENNLVFSEATSQTISYYETMMDVDSFNTENSGLYSNSIVDNLSDDPLFVSANSGNYHLQPESSCIDAGASILASFDYEGNSIPNGLAPDIGIYEYLKVVNLIFKDGFD